MKSKLLLTACFLNSCLLSHSQWEVGAGAGVAIPITGYADGISCDHCRSKLQV